MDSKKQTIIALFLIIACILLGSRGARAEIPHQFGAKNQLTENKVDDNFDWVSEYLNIVSEDLDNVMADTETALDTATNNREILIKINRKLDVICAVISLNCDMPEAKK